ncbi:hypothetical protein STIAU_4548, partial [Stigmatella aurantiaca DW4/3-1]
MGTSAERVESAWTWVSTVPMAPESSARRLA